MGGSQCSIPQLLQQNDTLSLHSSSPWGRPLVLSTWPDHHPPCTMSASLSLHPSVYLYIQACVLSPGFDFRLNRRPVRRVEASSPAEAPGRGEGTCGQVSFQGGYSVLGSGVARGALGKKGRMGGPND